MTAEDQFLLLWKGRQSGPFSIEKIREKLLAGDINRMNQINVDGRWQILDDYLEKLRGADSEARKRRDLQVREAESKRLNDARLQEERAKREGERSSLSHLLPQAPAFSPVFQPIDSLPPGPPSAQPGDPLASDAPPPPFPSSEARTSRFAIAALVMGLCNFIPFVNFISWILALVFGHLALSQMKVDESLKGRGMAIAGLVITYFLLVMVITIVALCLANNKPLPHF